MTLTEIKNSFIPALATLGGVQEVKKMTGTQLIKAYCMYADEDCSDPDSYEAIMKNAFYAGVMYCYISCLWKFKTDFATLRLIDDEIFDYYQHAIDYTLKKRQWEDPTNKLYNEPDGPNAAMLVAMGQMKAIAYDEWNKGVRKGEVLKYSIDAQVDENGDCALEYVGATCDDVKRSGVDDIIELYIQHNKFIEALIVDGIIRGNPFKGVKVESSAMIPDDDGNAELHTYKGEVDSFNERMLVQHLTSTVDENYISAFCSMYRVNAKEVPDIMSKLKKLNNSKLYKYIEKTKIEIRTNPEMMAILTN